MNARQNQLHRTATACHTMSLIRRQNRKAREWTNRQRQHISNISSTNHSSLILMECSSYEEDENPNELVSTPTEQGPNGSDAVINNSSTCGPEQQHRFEVQSSGSNNDFENKSSWDTYWRQMNGPPPYRGMKNRETFQLVLKTWRNGNTEIRYYVEEPLERDPHCLTSDQGQAMIPVAPHVYHGSIVAEWTGLTSASVDEESVLTLAVEFYPKIPISLEERVYYQKQDVSSFIFFLFGYRHGNVHEDYKKECPADCNHEAHQSTGSREPKLPELRFLVGDLKKDLRFSSYSCTISSPAETISFSSTDEREFRRKQLNSNRWKQPWNRPRYPKLTFKTAPVSETKKQDASEAKVANDPLVKNKTPPKPSGNNEEAKLKSLRERGMESTDMTNTTPTISSNTGAVSRFLEMNWKRSDFGSKRPSNGIQLSTTSFDSRSATDAGVSPMLKQRKCFLIDEANPAAIETNSHPHPNTNPNPNSLLNVGPSTLASLEISLTTDNRERFNDGNLYAKLVKSKESEYYMCIPSASRQLTKTIKKKIGYLELEFPILGKLTFLHIPITNDRNDLYKHFSKAKAHNQWLQFSNEKSNVFILEPEILPKKPHNRAKSDLFSRIDLEGSKPRLFD